jgi:enediyne polyketide synthase
VASVQRTLAPKVRGARNVLSALDPSRLRLCVAFGSVIARSGMRGEADYALANEWLSGVLERWQAEHPHCRCITVEWSVWSGIGMGERLGRVDALAREGTSAIPPEAGSAALRHLLGSPPPATSVVVAGRLGAVPTLEFDRADLPFLRFLERPRVHCPGVELVAEADLSVDADPYLADHVIDGERVLPAVMGLEAMAQAATALVDAAAPPVFDDVRFDRPVVVPAEATRTIRLAALVTTPGVVEVALRSEETGFQVDHFRATCRFGEAGPTSTAPVHCAATSTPPTVLAQPERDLYGGILFHGQRFRRLRGYSLLRATECCAEVAPGELSAWFGRYLPPALLLGDPAARDAAIHAVQACLPHRRLLPIAVDRLVPCASAAQGPWQVHACERAQDGDTFVYDLEVRDGAGHSRERWEGLRLRAVSRHEPPRAWSDPLLGPYLERRLAELIPGAAVSVAVERSATRRSRGNRAIERALGGPTTIRRRPNGKPEVDGGRAVSCAHSGDLCVGVAADGCVSCDVEAVRARPRRVWLDLLGPERLMLAEVLGREAGDDLDAAATRAWAAGECLQKVGAPPGGPLILRASTADGWVLLSSGRHRVATLVASVRGDAARLAVAILVGDQDAGV